MSHENAWWQYFESLETFAESPRYIQWLTTILLALCLGIASYVGYFSAKLMTLERLIMRETEQTLSLLESRSQVIERGETQVSYRAVEHLVDDFTQRIPFQLEQATIVSDVDKLAQRFGLGVTHLKWGSKQTIEPFLRMPLHVELHGQYHAIGEFMAQLAQMEQVMTFEHMIWQQHSPTDDSVRVTANIHFYWQGERNGLL
ncbi:type 4a pilus biogenesis protein PilO [Vibrio olivae]|uniref:Type 4a pilus biogenesis protein PilO n=1 Tax=Vibrio olivae TaxID=1243002 RepID=A0ABV5HQH4_9VIBR